MRRAPTRAEELERLYQNARGQKESIKSPEEKMDGHRKLTIDGFMDLLYAFFNKSNMLIDSSTITSPQDSNKFIFTEVYPDTFDKETPIHNVVTFEISKREPAYLNSKAVDGDGARRFMPRKLGSEMAISGHNVEYNEQYYDNEITFTVWSEKSSDARRIARFIENYMIRNYHTIRQHVGLMHYKGRGRTIMSSDYGPKRLFGIPMTYLIRTEEPGYCIKESILSAEVQAYLATISEMDAHTDFLQSLK